MTNPIAAAERIVAHLARCVVTDELRADAAVLLEMAREHSVPPEAASADLITFTRGLRELRMEAGWLAVGRHVQQLRRAAWIEGRDAAAQWHETETADGGVDLIGRVWHHRQCAKAIRALELPAQETGR